MHLSTIGFIVVIFCVEFGKSEVENDNYTIGLLQEKYADYGKTWMFFPDGDGVPRMMILGLDSETDQNIQIEPRSKPGPPALFKLYTRKNINDSFILTLNDTETFKSSPFDIKKKTKILTHGWMSSGESDTCQFIKNAYLNHQDVNVIIVDWEDIASNIIYFVPMVKTGRLGDHVAEFIDFLYNEGVKLKDVHMIGHSLGAHVSGNAGARVTKGKVGRISGLDPALPGFGFSSTNEKRLDKSDAMFVDIIHTCAGVLGYASSLGHVDFYPNGGTPSQPGCCCVAEIVESCSHIRAWKYFVESINDPLSFQSVQCDSWKDFKMNNCTHNYAFMGDPASPSLRGKYYLVTQKEEPYARGARGLKWKE